MIVKFCLQFRSVDLTTTRMQLQSARGPQLRPGAASPAAAAATDRPRVAAQGSGLRGLWLLGVGRSVRAWSLYQPTAAGRSLRRPAQAIRSYPSRERVQHRGLRLLPGCAVDRSRWSQARAHHRQASHTRDQDVLVVAHGGILSEGYRLRFKAAPRQESVGTFV